jgi:hypothetical protein
MLQNQGCSRAEISSHVIRPDPTLAVHLSAVPGQHENRRGAEAFAEIDITDVVPDDDRPRRIERVLSRGPPNHARARLAAIASVVRAVRAEVYAIEDNARPGQQLAHPLVNARERRDVEVPSCHTRLIRDDHEPEPRRPQAAETVGNAGFERYAGGIGEIVALDDERAVAIEQDEASGGHRDRCPSTGAVDLS